MVCMGPPGFGCIIPLRGREEAGAGIWFNKGEGGFTIGFLRVKSRVVERQDEADCTFVGVKVRRASPLFPVKVKRRSPLLRSEVTEAAPLCGVMDWRRTGMENPPD